jgi:glucose/mannose-6-phosphate isomerase
MEKINETIKSIRKIRQVILNFPKQFTQGIKFAQEITLPIKLSFLPKNLIVCGMGGSALTSEILSGITSLDIITHKSYGLPPQAKKDSLVICISFSGNTEETVSALKEALRKKLSVIIITNGGELAKIAQKKKIPVIIISPEIADTPPRLTLGIQFAALSQILVKLNLLPNSFLKEISRLDKLDPKNQEKEAKKLARKIENRIPLIYFPHDLKGLDLIWKNNFNENSKIPSFTNSLPEMNHSEIVGFNKKQRKDFIALIIQDQKDRPEMLKRIKITKKILESKGIKTEIIKMKGKNQLEKIFSCALFGVWVSYYLAIKFKVDPLRINEIKQIKKELKS